MTKPESAQIERFSFKERLLHWLSALTFLYTALTGLALWSPRLFGLTTLMGGGETVRAWHPWSGILFTLVLAEIFRRWARQMRIDREDRQWLARSRDYALNRDEQLPPVGRFNAGQKMLFWLQSACCVVLAASGLVLWFPESTPVALRLAAILIHPVAAVAAISLIVVHIYMGILVIPGALQAMLHGRVSRSWAKSHHSRWHRETSEN